MTHSASSSSLAPPRLSQDLMLRNRCVLSAQMAFLRALGRRSLAGLAKLKTGLPGSRCVWLMVKYGFTLINFFHDR